MSSSSSIIAIAAQPAVKSSVEELQSKVTEMEGEIAALKAENTRLKKYELQILEQKYGRLSAAMPMPSGFMGYGRSEWSSNASSGC
jgi:cob(I)alamin adenosyltransferase